MGRRKAKAQEQPKVETPKVKEPKQTHTSITCTDCGDERIVKVQDAKQVTRCVECQANYRKMKRREYRKNRLAKLRTQKEQLVELAKKHKVPERELEAVLV